MSTLERPVARQYLDSNERRPDLGSTWYWCPRSITAKRAGEERDLYVGAEHRGSSLGVQIACGRVMKDLGVHPHPCRACREKERGKGSLIEFGSRRDRTVANEDFGRVPDAWSGRQRGLMEVRFWYPM